MSRFRFKLAKEPFLVHGISLASFGDDIIIIYLDEEDDLRVVKIGGGLRVLRRKESYQYMTGQPQAVRIT